MENYTKRDIEALVWSKKIYDMDTSEYPYITLFYVDKRKQKKVQFVGEEFNEEETNKIFGKLSDTQRFMERD